MELKTLNDYNLDYDIYEELEARRVIPKLNKLLKDYNTALAELNELKAHVATLEEVVGEQEKTIDELLVVNTVK